MKWDWVVIILAIAVIIAIGFYIKYPWKPQNDLIIQKWMNDSRNELVIAFICDNSKDYEKKITASYPGYDIIQETKEGSKCYYLLRKK